MVATVDRDSLAVMPISYCPFCGTALTTLELAPGPMVAINH